jgi:hypothetical protein
VDDCGFKAGSESDFDCGDIELKFGFRKNGWINRRKRTVSESFDWSTIGTNVYLLTKIWMIRCDTRSFSIEGRR